MIVLPCPGVEDKSTNRVDLSRNNLVGTVLPEYQKRDATGATFAFLISSSTMGQASSTRTASGRELPATLFPLPSSGSDLADDAVLDVELEIVSAKVRNHSKYDRFPRY